MESAYPSYLFRSLHYLIINNSKQIIYHVDNINID